ncbi:MAG: LysM peptidoglycan-binding domain-containing protein [Bacteroidaceae bacterium]|nr:LysM peptidoglycan-binding domain-containing protein [Bacteroidaceae bacterium]
MNIDIYIKETDGTREIRIPWLPDKVVHDGNGSSKITVDILDQGEVDIPNGRTLRFISWSSYFPGAGNKNLPFLRGKWQNPKNLQSLLMTWKDNNTPLRVIMTGYPINHDVYVDDFKGEYFGSHGDFAYDLTLKTRRAITVISEKVATTATTETATTAASSAKNYTIKSGDTLWGIAQKNYGNGAQYKKIYDANKTIIEETAKKHGKSSSNGGHWIYPGTVLQIP